jgi:ribosomal-protein-alanine N-acetyltransferase
MKAPDRFETSRLILRKPTLQDAEAVFTRYSSDKQVTKYLGWPRHQSIGDTQGFLAFSDAEWDRSLAGPYLIESGSGGNLLGSTGLGFESSTVASTGYVLARDAWGYGYATEALTAIVRIAQSLGVSRLYALCHPDNPASIRVLEKCNFRLEGRLKDFAVFPNLGTGRHDDCLRYARGQ